MDREAVCAALRRIGMRSEKTLDYAASVASRLEELEEQDPNVRYRFRKPRLDPAGKIIATGGYEPIPSNELKAARAWRNRVEREKRGVFAASDAYERCGRDWVTWSCANKHMDHQLKYCGLATICPTCAGKRAAELLDKYLPRLNQALKAAQPGLRPRLVTLALRPTGTETKGDALERALAGSKSTLRICYAIPVKRADWQIYFLLHPVTKTQIERAGSRRKAMSARRRALREDPLRRAAGYLLSAEFGERAMLAHTHALVLGRYVPQEELARCWSLVNDGQSFIADVRAIDRNDETRGLREVVKYAVKFTDRTPDQLAEIYQATCGRRRVEAFGCLRKKSEEERAAEMCPKAVCKECGEPIHPLGLITEEMWASGVRAPPDTHRFKSASSLWGAGEKKGSGP